MRIFLAQRPCPGLVKWGSRVLVRLRSAFCSCLIINLFCIFLAPGTLAQELALESNTTLSTDGYFVLSWTSDETNTEFRLEESSEQDFANSRLIYSGPDKSRVISGKPNGVYRYRLVSSDAQIPVVSELVTVEVKHHSLQRALAFFFLGLFVFGAILVTVVLGMRAHRDGAK